MKTQKYNPLTVEEKGDVLAWALELYQDRNASMKIRERFAAKYGRKMLRQQAEYWIKRTRRGGVVFRLWPGYVRKIEPLIAAGKFASVSEAVEAGVDLLIASQEVNEFIDIAHIAETLREYIDVNKFQPNLIQDNSNSKGDEPNAIN